MATPKRFTSNAYSGGELRLAAYRYPVVVDLTGISAARERLPILRDHDTSKVVGHTTEVVVGKSGITIHGVISGANEHSAEVTAASQNGFAWGASIGAQPTQMDFVDEGQTVGVNGQEFTGPMYVARRAVLSEVSVTAIGADASANFSVAAKAASQQSGVFHMSNLGEFIQFEDDGKQPSKKIAASATGGGRKQETTTTQPESSQAVTLDDIRAERSRICDIEILADGHPDLQARAIKEGWSIEKTELEIMREQQTFDINAGILSDQRHGQRPQNENEILACALANRMGVKVDDHYDEKTCEIAASKQYRNTGVRSIAEQMIEATGASVNRSNLHTQVIQAEQQLAIKAAGGGGGFSTLGLTSVLADSLGKVLRQAYAQVPGVRTMVSDTRNADDFRQVSYVQLESTELPPQLGPGGEIKHTELVDSGVTDKLRTYAEMLAITREMLINDDLGAFMQVPMLFGRQMSKLEEKNFWTLILGGEAAGFFSVGNGNLLTAVLSDAALTSAISSFRTMTGPDNEPILVEPAVLIVGPAQEYTARQLLNSALLNPIGAATVQTPSGNPHASAGLSLGVTPYLTGNEWLLTSAPESGAPVATRLYLQGRNSPTVESDEADFNTLGRQLRSYFDFSAALVDTAGGVYSNGST